MSESIERHAPLRPSYVIGILLFVIGMSGLQFLIAAGLYWGLYGAPTLDELMTIKTPEYSHAALWNGRVVYPVRQFRPNVPLNSGVLMSFDPENGDHVELKVKIPFPVTGLVADNHRLWAVSTSQIVLVEGEQTTEFAPSRTLTSACEPFLYEGQLAVIETGTAARPTLLVLQNNDWVDFGKIVIPFAYHLTALDGKRILEATPDSQSAMGSARLMELQVVSHDGQPHLFFHDGVMIAYRKGLELAPVSALAPANVDTFADLSQLADWQVVCDAPANIGMKATRSWKAGLVDGEPVVLAVSAAGTNPFQNVSIIGYRRINGAWQELDRISIPAVMELLAVSNGQTTYFAGCSIIGQILRIQRLSQTEMHATGAVVKPPLPGFTQIQSRSMKILQWVYWPGLLIFVLGVSRLMRTNSRAEYQFGVTTVELASFTRRSLARVVDYFLYVGAGYLVTFVFFGSATYSQEQAQQNVDKIFEMGPNGMMFRWAYMILSGVVCYLLILIVTSWFQGRWGVTLGKWLLGIRTMRSTLRPCGFLRAMLRELLLLADTLFAISYLPATLMIAFTSCRQRIGDVVADTIVIRRPCNRRAED